MSEPDIDYGHGDETRVANTQMMQAIMAEAKRLDLNRRLDQYMIDYKTAVDESGDLRAGAVHILVPVLIHKMAKEKPVEPHMRVHAHLMFRDTIVTRPEERILDIPMKLWKALPTAKQLEIEDPSLTKARADREQWSRDTALARYRIGRGGRAV